MRRRPKQYDTVIIPSIGREGCVVEIYDNGIFIGYEVEIFDTKGNTIGLETFKEEDIYVVIREVR